MDHLHSTTTEHRKGQHLTFEHRVLIQTRLKDGWSPARIAQEIGCAPNTVRNEIKRGTVALYKGNILRYKASAGQDAYEHNRQSCCRHYDFLQKTDFIAFVEQKFFEEGWSLDACVGRALEDGLFTRDQIVCTKTLYGYTDLGLLGINNKQSKLPIALENMTQNQTQINTFALHLDNDFAGRNATKSITEQLRDRFIIRDEPPLYGKDCNDYLQHMIRRRCSRQMGRE